MRLRDVADWRMKGGWRGLWCWGWVRQRITSMFHTATDCQALFSTNQFIPETHS